jgi:hypothetical protein
VSAFNERRGARYALVEKKVEDRDKFPDRELVSKRDDPNRLSVEITHFDASMAAVLGKCDPFDATRTSGELDVSIRGAIERKACIIDPREKQKTILLLIVPSPLGRALRSDLQGRKFDVKGFREVWISLFHEMPFWLCSDLGGDGQ